ncbi:MAG: GxxExxY protein [Flavobacteriales bacterium]
MTEENQIATEVIACAIRVHRALGAGLLEKVYQECLFYELNKAGIYVKKEYVLPIKYDGIVLESGLRIDLLVEDKLVVELKSVDEINDVHMAQTLTYLKLSDCKLGLIINFNVALLKQGIKRIINNPVSVSN